MGARRPLRRLHANRRAVWDRFERKRVADRLRAEYEEWCRRPLPPLQDPPLWRDPYTLGGIALMLAVSTGWVFLTSR
jgi:hypothetical protein